MANKLPKEIFNRTKTDIPWYDNMMENPEYFKENKGVVFEIKEMTPDEYFQATANMNKTSMGAEENMVFSESQERIKRAVEGGAKLYLPYLDYKDNSQEGRNRAHFAKSIGIKSIPVLVIKKASCDSWIRIRADVKSLLKQLIPLYKDLSKEEAIKRIYEANSADPTGENRASYTRWIVQQDIKGNFNPDNKSKYFEALRAFEKVKNGKKITKKNIFEYPSFEEFYNTMDKFIGSEAQPTSNAEEKRMLITKGQKVVLEEGPFKVIEVTNAEAATEIFRDYQDVCLKDPKFSKDYLSKGPIFAILKNNRVYAIAENTGTEEQGTESDVKDVHDNFINEIMFKELKTILDKLGIFLSYMSDDYTSKDKIYFKNDAKSATLFAKEVLKGPFIEAEEIIKKDTYWWKKYLDEVLNREDELAKISSWIKKEIPISHLCCRIKNNK